MIDGPYFVLNGARHFMHGMGDDYGYAETQAPPMNTTVYKKRFDAFSAGAPCTPFAPRGGGLRKHDPKAQVLWHVASFIRQHQPIEFFFENSAWLASLRSRDIFTQLRVQVEGAEYTILMEV